MGIQVSGQEDGNRDVDIALETYNAGNTQTGDTTQAIHIVDAICEGPIKGLVGGTAGVYFNDVSAQYAEYGEFVPTAATSYGTVTFSGGDDVTGTFSSDVQIPDILGNREVPTIVLINYAETQVTLTKDAAEYMFTATATSGTPFSASRWDETPGKGGYTLWRTLEGGGVEVIYAGYVDDNNSNTMSIRLNTDTLTIDTSATYTLRKAKNITIAQFIEDEQTGKRTQVELVEAPEAGTYNFRITEVPVQSTVADRLNQRNNRGKIDQLTIQSRNGERGQDVIAEVEGIGGSTVIQGDAGSVNLRTIKLISEEASTALNIPRINPEGMPSGSTDFNNDATILTSSTFGLSLSQIKEVDQLRWSIRYPALQTLALSGGERDAYAYYVMQVDFKREESAGFENNWVSCFPSQSTTEDFVIHSGRTNAPVSFEHILNLEAFRPFIDFKIRIVRVNRHIGLPIGSDGTSEGRNNPDDWQVSATGTVTTLTAHIKDKFNYPYTAIVASSFSSKQFDSTPRRSYLMEGLLVKVPSNYTPREYSTAVDSSGNPKAVYNGFWDGSFKYQYTDNPAWVFYDIVTNNRYGAGKWISENDIDKYALYRIARYCDELVDDGKGGVEPRFRANVFLAKATDVYKVLKDMATIFLGILYWQDEKITPVQDAPQDPVYAFSKSNVIDGKFNYESTGARTRINQVVVTWNDPTINYEPTPLLVEDRDAIAREGRVISQKSVAFGATSEGQAIRYGRWKLWTAQNQTELVSFKTSLAGHYVKPGDVITIQDADRYGLQYSGRISSYTAAVAGTSPASITVDRTINYVSGASYTLNTVVTSAAAFWTGTSNITINGVTTRPGERLVQAYVPGAGLTNLNTEEKASNAFADSSFTEPLGLVWRPYTYVQETPVTNNGGTSSNVITLSGTDTEFDVVPEAGTVWSLKEINSSNEFFDQQGDEVVTLGSTKEYRVISISEDSKNEISIAAVEHYNTKYDVIENGFEVATLTTSQPVENGDEVIPPPRNLRVVVDTDVVDPGKGITVEWDPPANTEENYELVTRYELYHNVPEVKNPVVTSTTNHFFPAVPGGSLYVQLRSVTSKGNRSVVQNLRYFVQDFDTNIQRVQEGIPKGIFSQYTAVVNNDEELQFEFSPCNVVSLGDSLGDARVINSDDNIDLTGIKTTQNIEYFVFLDNSTIGLYYYDTESLQSLPYWRPISVGDDKNSSQQAHWTQVATGVSVLEDSNEVTGTSLGTLTTRDIVILGNNTTLVPMSVTGVTLTSTSVSVSFTNTTENSNTLTNGDRVQIYDLGGSTELNGRDYFIGNISTAGTAVTATLYQDYALTEAVAGADITAWTSGGEVRPSPFCARVISVVDNTKVVLDRSIPAALSGTKIHRRTYRADVSGDALFATVYWDGANYNVSKHIILDPSLLTGKALIVSPNTPVISYDSTGAQTSFPGEIRVTCTAVGFVDPIFKISTLSAGFATGSSISSIDGDTATITVITSNSHNLAANDLITISGTANYNGNFTVSGVTNSTTFTIASTSHNFDAETDVGSIQMRTSSSTDILSIDGDAATITVQTTSAHGLVPNDPILISGTTNYDNIFTVNTVTSSTSFTIASTLHNFDAETNVGTVTLQLDELTSFQEPDTAGGFIYTRVVDLDGLLPYREGKPETITVEVAERYNVTDTIEGVGTIIKIDEGSDGVDGKTVFLDSEDFSIIYDETGANPVYNQDDVSDTTLTFTATAYNFTDPKYRFTLDLGPEATAGDFTTSGFDTFNTAELDGTGIATLTVPALHSSWAGDKKQGTANIKVEVIESADLTETVLAFDEISLQAIHALKGGYWTSLSNDSHTISCTAEGVPLGTAGTLEGVVQYFIAERSGTTIEVGKGSTILTYVAPSYDINNNLVIGEGEFTVVVTDADNVEPLDSLNIGTLDATNTSLIAFGDHEFSAGWTDDIAQISYDIYVETAAQLITRRQSFSKSKQGFNGITVVQENQFESLPGDKNGNVIDFAPSANAINVYLSGINLPFYVDDTYASAASADYWWEYLSASFDTNEVDFPQVGGLYTYDDEFANTSNNGTLGFIDIGPINYMPNATATISYTVRVHIGATYEDFTVTQRLSKTTNSSNISGYMDKPHYSFDGDGGTPNPATGYRLSWVTTAPSGMTVGVQIDGTDVTATELANGYKDFSVPTYGDGAPVVYTLTLTNEDVSPAEVLDTDTVVLSKTKNGADDIILELDNDSATVGGTEGTDITGISEATTVTVYKGGVDDSSNWTYSWAVTVDTAGTSVTRNGTESTTGRTFTVTELNNSVGGAEFTFANITVTASHTAAQYDDHQKTFTITKILNGENGVVYKIVPETGAVIYDPNNSSYTGGSGASNKDVVFNFRKIAPDGTSSAFDGKYSLDGGSTILPSTGTVSSYTYTGFGTIPATVNINLYDSTGTQLLDQEGVPLILNGTNAEILSLSADHTVFVKQSDGTITPSGGITFTANSQNIVGTLSFSAVDQNGSSLALTGTGTSRTLTVANFGSSTSATVTVSAGGYSDSESVELLEAASNTITAALTKDNFQAPSDADGANPVMSGSSTSIEVYEGANQLEYDGSGTTAGTWTVSPSGSNGIIPGTITDSGSVALVGDASKGTGTFSGTTADTAVITFTITGKRQDGSSFTTSKAQTFSKVKKGNPGDPGDDGDSLDIIFARAALGTTPTITSTANPPSGNVTWYTDPPSAPANGSTLLWAANGTLAAGSTAWSWSTPYKVEGSAIAELIIYSDATTGSAPGTPTSTYNFTNNSLSIGTVLGSIQWNNSPPSLTTDGQKIWQLKGLASGSPQGTSVAVTWYTPATIYSQYTVGDPGPTGGRGAGRWYIGVSSLPTTSAGAASGWTNGTFVGTSPGDPVVGDQAWFFTGNITNPTGQVVWIYEGSSTWVKQEEVVDGNLLVDGTITADKMVIGATGLTSSRMLLLDDSLKIFDGTSLRVHLGNLNNTTT